jgi:LPS export ABC transporter protein LptC
VKLSYWVALMIIFGFVTWLGPFEKTSISNFRIDTQPQEYMSNVSVWAFTKTGGLEHHLSADYWAYLPKIKSSTLIEPLLIVYKSDHTLWKIQAKHGKIHQPTMGHIDQVELSDTVILQRPETADAVPIKLETEQLRYQPKTQYAETERFITMTKPNLKITGVGMRAFLENSSVELLHNVKTFYEATLR